MPLDAEGLARAAAAVGADYAVRDPRPGDEQERAGVSLSRVRAFGYPSLGDQPSGVGIAALLNGSKEVTVKWLYSGGDRVLLKPQNG